MDAGMIEPWKPSSSSPSTRSTCPTSSSGRCRRRSGRAPSRRCASSGRCRSSRSRTWRSTGSRRARATTRVTRHADIVEASRQPELFCSGRGAVSILDMPEEFLEFFGSMINMDDPRHARLRGIVSAGFTPGCSAGSRTTVQAGGGRHRRPTCMAKGECDFVTEVAARLPLQDHLRHDGHPRVRLRRGVQPVQHHPRPGRPRVRPRGHRHRHRAARPPAQELAELVQDLGAYRQRAPDRRPDLGAGQRRRSTASSSPTRSWRRSSSCSSSPATRPPATPSATASLLTDHPDQRAPLAADFDAMAPTAVEEIVRWASPVIWMRRTATRDTDARRPAVPRGRQGPAVLQLGQPRRGRVRRPVPLRRPARPQPPRRLRRARARTSASAPTWPAGRSR